MMIMITISLILFIPILVTGFAFFICSKFIRKTCREIAFLRAEVRILRTKLLEVRRVLVSQKPDQIHVSKTRLI
jgi:hypothetical protein